MTVLESLNLETLDGSRSKDFQKLMRHKVRDILLVASLYDQYLFEEDGRLYELIRQEFQVLNLSHPPEITHLTSAAEALDLLSSGEHFDLIITTLHIEDMHVIQFAREARTHAPDVPLILLAYDNRERKELVTQYDVSVFDRAFIWQGDYRLLIAIIKHIEDRINVEEDTRNIGVQVIILVEDDVKFYSRYLPLIYTEILNQSQRLITEGVSLTHRYMRMRARPKILLCTTFEEAWAYFEKFQEYILGIISDVNFKRNGVKDPEGGFVFADMVRRRQEDIPLLLQSSNRDLANRARAMGLSFLWKNSPRLLHDLREFMMENFGFGDFVFRLPSGQEVGRASNLKTLEEYLVSVPDESIEHHARRNHFSNWLKARTEFWLAHRLRPRKVEDFANVTELRSELIHSLLLYQEIRQRGVITDFSRESFNPKNSFARIGSGSLGGKARGLGFINTLINSYEVHDRFPGVEICVPSAAVIATDVFDRFLAENGLEAFAQTCTDDEELFRRFQEAEEFPEDIVDKLLEFLSVVKQPLAVRSSSLLEDSQYQPFAGVYETYMIPNNNPDDAVRLYELLQSIKLVYASTFSTHAKDYMKATDYRLEEEKMAVIVQRMVGSEHHDRFYPDFAGVGKSYNFYPVAPQKSTDGIVHVALGLGKTVVDGGNSVRFCPSYPRHLLQFFSTAETIRTAQQEFYALDLHESLNHDPNRTPDSFVKLYDLTQAERDNTLFAVGSTYSAENDTVYDGLSREGKRVVTFAPILKHKAFPLPEIIDLILEMGTWGMGTAVEVEFAVNLTVQPDHPREFGVLQIRPLVLSRELEELKIGKYERRDLICESQQVLGNGALNDICDIVVVDIETFDRSKSRDVAAEAAHLNAKLLKERQPYLLIGVGRWGSTDQWLGIPVTWDQISGAAAIVESGFKDLSVAPSQGSHFFQNITSFRVGYFTIDATNENSFVDWEWLAAQEPVERLTCVRHLRFETPLLIRINGHQNRGVILKPGRTGTP
jgi:CheY-like chemotaxis protein